ncbi:hypothetical protein K466DRAFT_597931 [Polyporus arcularius HHB13444]|uniref:Uncharacterized protein n=1 Tax=Polyporus arcularius HHB13444 TaxID=1314778 RepID=A0A5C3PK59_9APHY|nr:hypothetical protein K466DRAFT_597931 [Polyporus arcularius HHB13444]
MAAKRRLFPFIIARRILGLLLSDTPTLRSILFDEGGNDSTHHPRDTHSAAQFERDVWFNAYAHYQDKGATLSRYRRILVRTLEVKRQKGSSEHEYIFAHVFADSNDLRDPREVLVGYIMTERTMAGAPDTTT